MTMMMMMMMITISFLSVKIIPFNACFNRNILGDVLQGIFPPYFGYYQQPFPAMHYQGRGQCGVGANMLDCDILLIEFEPQ